MNYTITNPKLFAKLDVRVDIQKDNIEVSFLRNGERKYIESWGEHGPNDFLQFGFTLVR